MANNCFIYILIAIVFISLIHISSTNEVCSDCIFVNDNQNLTKNLACKCTESKPFICHCCLPGVRAATLEPVHAAWLVSEQIANESEVHDPNSKECPRLDSNPSKCKLDLTDFNILLRSIYRARDEPAKHLRQLPRNPNTFKTQFQVYTNLIDFREPLELDYLNETEIKLKLRNYTFDKIYIVTHGFKQGINRTQFLKLKDGLLTVRLFDDDQIKEPLHQNPAVIMLDWHGGSKASKNPSRFYSGAAVTTMVVGRQVALLSYFLVQNRIIAAKDIHLIGFSLGGQVMHFAGEHFQVIKPNSKIGRITGLDPAGPHFERHAHLSKSDADFVDVIHTATMSMENGFVKNGYAGQFGMYSPAGHIDFYPNDGLDQPHCSGGWANSCSHQSSIHYFTDSLKNDVNIRRKLVINHSVEYFKKPISMGIESIKNYNTNYMKLHYLDDTHNVIFRFPYKWSDKVVPNHSNRKKRKIENFEDICQQFQTTCKMSDLKKRNIRPIMIEPNPIDGLAKTFTKAYFKCWKPGYRPYMLCSKDGIWRQAGNECPADHRFLTYGLSALIIVLILTCIVLLPLTVVRRRRRRLRRQVEISSKDTKKEQEPL